MPIDRFKWDCHGDNHSPVVCSDSVRSNIPCVGASFRLCPQWAGIVSTRRVISRIVGEATDTNNKESSTMPRAMWKGQVIAESDDTVIVEGNHYFPQASLNRDFFKSSSTTSVCGWKGTAQYFDVEVDGQVNRDAAWYYPDPKPAAENIRDRVAFWRGVQVE